MPPPLTGPTLRAALWSGPLPDPEAPARDLATRIAAGAEYLPVLADLQQLAGHGLPLAPALAPALARWDWSIDMALLAVQTGADGAMQALAARVHAQNRRHAALARALWSQGEVEHAIAHLTAIDRRAETWAEDTVCLAEFLWHMGQTDRARATAATVMPNLPPGPAARLWLLGVWLGEGAGALALAQSGRPLPDDTGLWSFLLHACLTERDLPGARAALTRLAALRAPGDPETVFDKARLALDAEAPATARAALDTLPAIPPADWPQRRHVLHLRALLAQGDMAADPQPPWQAALAHGLAAARLHPGNPALRGTVLPARERCQDWESLAADLMSDTTDPARIATLARLGLPRPEALTAPTGPDSAVEQAKLRGDLHLETGAPDAALAATALAPLSAIARARLAETRAEALLWQRRPAAALALLDAALGTRPAHMGMWLQLARARFLLGDFAAAESALTRFRRLKQGQTGHPPATDLRDRITADARASGQSLPPDEDAATSRDRLGPALARHPGLAACWLARPGAVPPFHPGPADAIPHHAGLYWEGPMPAPVARGIARWREMLAGWQVDLFDAPAARAWLTTHDPDAAATFDRLTAPAPRADLFRACWIARAGGLFVDSDEYPRDRVTPWLDGATTVLVLESGYGTAANNFLAAAPGQPLMAAFRARVLSRLAATHTPYPWWDSGPAQLAAALAGVLTDRPQGWPGLRVLSQADYCTRVTTNLPFPHKRRPDHWRQLGAPSLHSPPDHGHIRP